LSNLRGAVQRVITDQDHEWDVKALAKRVALVKGIRGYGLRKVFTFHGRVSSAKSFTDTSKPYGIHHIFNLIESEKELSKTLGFFHVNGTMPSGTRSSILKEFESVDIGVMSNARCLVEGVNIPAVDTVAFIDPKRSLIDIVQATGRAMRKADWKENGYIFIPVLTEEDSDPEEIIESSDFDAVWEVLQAMLDQDQRMQGIVSRMRILQGKGEEGTQAWKDAMSEYCERIEFYDLPTKVDRKWFIEKLSTRIVEIIGRRWDFWYGLTLKYRDEFGDANAPHDYKTTEGFRLGSWQNDQRQNYKKGKLSPDRIERLEKIGFIWDILEEQFEKGFQETLLYKNSTGNPNADVRHKTPEGFRLGTWQSHQRSNYRKGILSSERIERLEKIGFIWDILEEQFENGTQETLLYKNSTGNPNVPARHKTPKGFLLGIWQGNQRNSYKKGEISSDRIKRLEKIGFIWDILEEQFENGIQETLLYKNNTGNPNANARHKTLKGFELGKWQSHQRSNYKKGELSSDRIKRLEEIGFIWDPFEEQFEKGFQETLNYKMSSGNPNTPNHYKTPKGYLLGSWQAHQRAYYRIGKLSPEKIKRFEEIGFTWELFEEQFEKGFKETLIYNKSTGNPNAPRNYMTPERYRIGRWQEVQKRSYNTGKLSPDRIKRLEEIGFKWKVMENKPHRLGWDRWYELNMKYKDEFGVANAANNYMTPERYRLGRWQEVQKRSYRKGELSPDRIKRLEEIGFKWGVQR
jgi:hypothetical protein